MDVLVLNAGADAALDARTALLRTAGFDVIQAGSANHTLAALAADPLPTILVLGVFSDMDAPDVLRAVRADPRTTFIKTLHLVPAELGVAYQARCLDSGANVVLPDTVPGEVLVAQLRALGSWVSRSTAALEESEARFRLISNATPLGIAIVDLRRGTFLFTNPACEDALGYGPGQLLGRHSGDVFNDAIEGEQLLGRIREKGSLSNVEVRLRRADGSNLWALGSARSLHFAGSTAAIAVVSDVTERKRIEQALHESEQRFRLALRHAPVSVAMQDRDLRYVWAFNEHAVRQAVDLGLGDDDLFPANQARHLTVLKRRVVQEGIELREQLWLDRRDGRIFVDAYFEPIRDNEGHIVGVGTAAVNLTGMKLAEQELRESRERYEAIFASAPFAIALLDERQRIVEANGAAERMFGISRQEAMGKTPSELGTLEARDLDDLYAQLGQQASISGVELHYTPRKGERCLAQFSMSRVRVQGQMYFLGTATDVTKQRRAESDLQHANAMLEESDRRKDEFIAILSHELRNPLAPIRYALPLLHPSEEDEAATRALAVIHRQVDHLTRLVDDLLDLSRISGGIIGLRRERRLLEAVVQAAIEAAMPAISAARHQLDVELPSTPVVVYGDAARLSQVITNLLNNSARYTPRGGMIRLSVRREDDRVVVIEVRDNGIGIPREALPHIFEMFRQVERPDRRQGGLGVGLALVKTFVEMHGGAVAAESDGVGQGATFTLRLPIAVAPSEADHAVVNVRQVASAAPPMRVLIVDDSADLVEMLSIAVEGAGHQVRKALDGQSAVAAALTFRPHVVLLDLGLPVMSGLEVAGELRRHPETSDAWLVALTGWGQAEDRRHTREAGFDYHLTKPTDPAELQQLLGRLSRQAR